MGLPHRLTKARSTKLAFALFVFGPFAMMFLVPLVFYRIPLIVHLATRDIQVEERYVVYAVAVCVAWFCTALTVFLWPRRSDWPTPPREWTAKALWNVFLIFSTLGNILSLAHSFFMMPFGLEELVHQLAFTPIIGFILGVRVLGDIRGIAGSLRRFFVWALLLVDLIVPLGVPVALSKVAPAAFGTIAILYGLRVSSPSWRQPVLVALFLIPLILISLPLKNYLRDHLYGRQPFMRLPVIEQEAGSSTAPLPAVPPPISTAAYLGRALQFDPWAAGLRFHHVGEPLALVEYGLSMALDRINRLSDLAYVVKMTPSAVPFADGATYRPLATDLIPRVFWQNKPGEVAGQFYGHRYGFLYSSNASGSYNLPIVTEGWLNGGWAGVLLSAAFVGVVLRFVWAHWIGASSAPGNIMIGMAIVGTATDGESNLSLVIGGVIHALLVYWALDVVLRFLDRRFADRRRRESFSPGVDYRPGLPVRRL